MNESRSTKILVGIVIGVFLVAIVAGIISGLSDKNSEDQISSDYQNQDSPF
jgi:flagellar basal body-associated protein FliL